VFHKRWGLFDQLSDYKLLRRTLVDGVSQSIGQSRTPVLLLGISIKIQLPDRKWLTKLFLRCHTSLPKDKIASSKETRIEDPELSLQSDQDTGFSG
jgi:hypothetical protein